MTTDDNAYDAPAKRWGPLGWAKWLPELANVTVVGLALLCAIESVVAPFSDDEIRQSIVDTYEVSAWNFMAVCLLATIGIGCAVVARFAAVSESRKRLALIQCAAMLVLVGVAAYGHYRVMQRTTELTGQSFEGFP